MADPVRVQREESFQTSGPPAVLTVGYVNPDDLARAIREGVDARLQEVTQALFNDGQYSLGLSFQRTLDAPREPAQERQEGGAANDYESGNDLARGAAWDPERWLRHYAACHGKNDGARRKLFKAADALLAAVHAPTPTPAPDPLLPGLRAARAQARHIRAQGLSATMSFDLLCDWLDQHGGDAEIARREGGA